MLLAVEVDVFFLWGGGFGLGWGLGLFVFAVTVEKVCFYLHSVQCPIHTRPHPAHSITPSRIHSVSISIALSRSPNTNPF
jgi:hypothetical protein